MVKFLKTIGNETLKRSPFIKRQVRTLRFRFCQPHWEKLLAKSADIWGQLPAQGAAGKTVLLATNVGAHLAGTVMESTLAAALRLNGASVHVLLCDQMLPACLACSFEMFGSLRSFDRYGPRKNLCPVCWAPAEKMFRALGVTVHRYSSLVGKDDLQKIEEIADAVPDEKIPDFTYEGIKVGEHALAGALRFFARGDLQNEPYGMQVLRRYFRASLISVFACRALLKEVRFDSAVFHHGIYVPQGLIGEVCRQKGVHVVNWNPAYRKGCFIFSHDDTYHHTMITEPVASWQTLNWTPALEKRLSGYLKSRWYGSNDWIWFHEKPSEDMVRLAKETGLDLAKPCIGMLTSVMWDAVLHYASNAFPNMTAWVLATIDYFRRRPDLQLVIRIHPAEIRGTLPSRQRIYDVITAAYSTLPPNVYVIRPEHHASTYALMSRCNAVLIYNTKTGIELAAQGIPVIVAGEAWIRNKGFSTDVSSAKEYVKILDTLPLSSRMSDAQLLLAKKYAYHFFFRRMIPLEFMGATGGDPPYCFREESLHALLPGRSQGLDTIINGILHGNDFIFKDEISYG